MPLFYQQDINETTRLGVWLIEEPEDFFLAAVPLSRAITHPHKRLQHLAGRYLLPHLFPDFPLQQIEIADTRKPFLPGEQFHFSISHCGNYAAALVSSTHRVGVDVEVVTPRVKTIGHKFLHPLELRFVNAYPAQHQVALLTNLWSAKEALFKWWGNGEVDFSDTLRIEPFDFTDAGSMHAAFLKPGFEQALQLHYRMMEGLSLVWLYTSASS